MPERLFADAELEAGTEALYNSAKGRIRPWVQYEDLTPEGAAFYRDKVSVVLAAVVLMIERRAQVPLLSLIEDLTDPDECWYDHHGYCQAHSLHEKPCPHERAKRVLARAHRTTPEPADRQRQVVDPHHAVIADGITVATVPCTEDCPPEHFRRATPEGENHA